MLSFRYVVPPKKVYNRHTNHGCREVHLLAYRWRCCQQFPFKTFRTESIISLSLWQREETSEFFLFSLAVSQHYPRGAQDICRNKWLGNVFLKMEKFSLSLPKRRKGEVKKKKKGKNFPSRSILWDECFSAGVTLLSPKWVMICLFPHLGIGREKEEMWW